MFIIGIFPLFWIGGGPMAPTTTTQTA